MTQTYFTSPFAYADDQENPWILWEKRDAVTTLNISKETDCRSDDCVESVPSTATTASRQNQNTDRLPIQRKQYNSVLNRMNQAVGKTGSFSSWQT